MKTSLKFALLALCLAASPAWAVGLLIPTESGLPPLSIKYHRATVKITDRAAVTHVDQVFINSTGRQLEATYIFPLPRGATVSDFYLYVNGKRTKGEVLEKNQARNIYEGIVRRMQDPGLLEYLDNDLFQCRIFPVPARGEQRFEIEFQQVLGYEGGLVKYLYPMRTDRASAKTIKDFTMSLEIASKTPIKAIYSPSHQIYQRKKGNHDAVAGFETTAATLDRDFELFYTVSDKEVGLNLLAYREPGEPGFFMLMASPSTDLREKEIMGKRITFVIDTSGSMSGKAMDYAKKALGYCVEKLNSDDLFNIVRFSTDVETFAKSPQAANKENVTRAQNFIRHMEAAGGTAIDEALLTALSGHQDEKLPNLVVFLTDGHPTVGETEPGRILAHVKAANKVGARMFVFGVGTDLNTRLLDSISSHNGGESTYVTPGKQIQEVLSAFYDKISHPVLTDIQLDFGDVPVFEAMPAKIPDLFKGGQVIQFGRYRESGKARIELAGLLGGEKRKFAFDAEFPERTEQHTFIPRLWATRRVGFLLEQIRLGGEQRELVDEVIRLGKRYGIVTPYTSYLVTEDTARGQPQPLVQASPPPVLRAAPSRPAEERSAMDGVTMGGAERRPTRAKAFSQPPASMSAVPGKAGGGGRLLEAESGEQAVSVAQAVADMKKSESARDDEDEAGGIRYAGGRAFRYVNGAWVDTRFENSMQVLKVKAYSSAYFALVGKSALLKAALTLGDRVVVVTGKDTAIEVHPDGKSELSDSEMRKFAP